MPDEASRYSVSGGKLCGLVANVSAFKRVLRNTEFTLQVDHFVLVHILRAKWELQMLQVKKLFEYESEYSL